MPSSRFNSIVISTPDNLLRAVTLLQQGELVALPTETVYGLGADASNPVASARIFAAKERPADHPLIVHLADTKQLGDWARDIPQDALKLAQAFWPGPMTLILKKQPHVPNVVTGGQDTIGLRIPDHPVALDLLRAFGSGIAAPSANRFGRISPTTAQHVQEEMEDRVAMILDGGACEVGIESTIIDLSRDEPVILRPGMIGADAIAAVIGRMPRGRVIHENAPRVSGALTAHYAPRTPMRLISTRSLENISPDSAVLSYTQDKPPTHKAMWIKASDEATLYAHDLYANLRALDASMAVQILVEALPVTSAWDAVQDRLGRAVAGSGQEEDET